MCDDKGSVLTTDSFVFVLKRKVEFDTLRAVRRRVMRGEVCLSFLQFKKINIIGEFIHS